jgi:hypothetical protein
MFRLASQSQSADELPSFVKGHPLFRSEPEKIRPALKFFRIYTVRMHRWQRLLRTCHERPSYRAPKARNKFAPSHLQSSEFQKLTP